MPCIGESSRRPFIANLPLDVPTVWRVIATGFKPGKADCRQRMIIRREPIASWSCFKMAALARWIFSIPNLNSSA